MYTPVIGLEIHLQTKTKSKMFCRCSSEYFSAEPNTHVCPVCFGLPGALPMINEEAFNKAIKLALALNCSINTETKFDRKNYFYPDLPKGYQISQFDKPIGEHGFVEIEVNDDSRRIRIRRVHAEEDTAKSLHQSDNETLIDYNKSGVALIEMVTEPDFDNKEEVLLFARRLRQIVRYTDTSDAEMQKGHMRFELNISIRKAGDTKLPDYKIEVKNIGSISVLEKVIEFEIARQSALLEKGEVIKNETRGLKDMSGETLFQRSKESADDYRYFPEPDIPPITIQQEDIDNFKTNMPELPLARKNRYLSLGLELEQADIFVEDTNRGSYFDSVIQLVTETDEKPQMIKEISKWINTEIAGLLLKRKLDFDKNKVSANDLITVLTLIQQKKITAAVAKKVLDEIFETSKSAESIIAEQDLIQIEDSSAIDEFIDQVIADNAKVIADISKNPNAIKFLVGQVMRLSKGRVNPTVAEEELQKRLNG